MNKNFIDITWYVTGKQKTKKYLLDNLAVSRWNYALVFDRRRDIRRMTSSWCHAHVFLFKLLLVEREQLSGLWYVSLDQIQAHLTDDETVSLIRRNYFKNYFNFFKFNEKFRYSEIENKCCLNFILIFLFLKKYFCKIGILCTDY